jgi:hypothetical protein
LYKLIVHHIMTTTKDNRTLAILKAATAGQYGVLSAIAYVEFPNILARMLITIATTSSN